MRVDWTAEALRGVAYAFGYLDSNNPRAASRLAAALLAAGDGLPLFPNRGPRVSGTNMRELVAMRPYIIRYRVMDDVVHILRIRHSARRPTTP